MATKPTPPPPPPTAMSDGHTVIEVFRHTAHRLSNFVALKYNGHTYSWREYLDESTLVARAILGYMKSIGVEPGTRMKAIVRLDNSARWMFVHTGLILAGAIPVDVSSIFGRGETLKKIADECDAKILFVDKWDSDLYDTVRKAHPEMRIVIVSIKPSDIYTKEKMRDKIIEGEKMNDDVINDVIEEIDLKGTQMYPFFLDQYAPQGTKSELRQIGKLTKHTDICQIVYASNPTSAGDGITFSPKGYMYSHQNVIFTSTMVGMLTEVKNDVTVLTGSLSANIHDQVIHYYMPHKYGTCVTILPGTYLSSTPKDDKHVTAIFDVIRDVRPTILFASPYIWELLAARAREMLDSIYGNIIFKYIKPWAESTALRGVNLENDGMSKPMGYGLARLALFDRVTRELGLNRLRYCAAIGPHLNRETVIFLKKCGIALHSTFGTPETCGITTVSIRGLWRYQWDGVPLRKDVTIDVSPGSWEIMVSGPNVFKGFVGDDSDGLNCKIIDEKSKFCYTGESGIFDKKFLMGDGHIREKYVTTEGICCDPRKYEEKLKGIQGVKYAFLIGDCLPYFSAVFVINRYDAIGRKKKKGEDIDDHLTEDEFKEYMKIVQKEVDESINSKVLKEYRIVKFAILYEGDFTKEKKEEKRGFMQFIERDSEEKEKEKKKKKKSVTEGQKDLFKEYEDEPTMDNRYRVLARLDQVINKIYGIKYDYVYEEPELKTIDEDTLDGAARARMLRNKMEEEEKERELKREQSVYFKPETVKGLLKKGLGEVDENGEEKKKKADGKKKMMNEEEEDEKDGKDESEDEKMSHEYSEDSDTSSSSSSGDEDGKKKKKKDKLKVKSKSKKNDDDDSSDDDDDESDKKDEVKEEEEEEDKKSDEEQEDKKKKKKKDDDDDEKNEDDDDKKKDEEDKKDDDDDDDDEKNEDDDDKKKDEEEEEKEEKEEDDKKDKDDDDDDDNDDDDDGKEEKDSKHKHDKHHHGHGHHSHSRSHSRHHHHNQDDD